MTQIDAGTIELGVRERIGERVRELRKSATLSLVQLSTKTGISHGHLSKIETGKANISIKALSQICLFFNRPMNYLFQQEETHFIGTYSVGEGPEKETVIQLIKDLRISTDNLMSPVRLEAEQVGTATNPIEYLRKGLIHIFMDDLVMYSEFVQDFDIFALPFIFTSVEHQVRFLESSFFEEKLRAPLLEEGIRIVNPRWNWFRGAKWVVVSPKPIFSPKDVKGCKVRIPDSKALKRYWESLGANPVFVPWEYASEALNAKEVDIMPCFKVHIYPMGFYKNAKYVTEIGSAPPALCVAMNEEKYQMLSPDLQAKLASTCDVAGENLTALVAMKNKEYESLTINEHGTIYIKVDINPWKAPLEQIKNQMIAAELLSPEVFCEIERIQPELPPL